MSLPQFAEAFSHFCKTGELLPLLPADPKRIEVYHDLTKRKIKRVLEKAFPMTVNLLEPTQWDDLVTQFLARGEISSPFFWRAPQGFPEFIQGEKWSEKLGIPYLDDLVSFEWLEVEIFMMADSPKDHFIQEGTILDTPLFINPESQMVTYSYPVFEKKKLPRPMEKGRYPLFAYRHPESGEVHFIALSGFFQGVLELLNQKPLTGREALTKAAALFKLDEMQVLNGGEKFFRDLINQHAIFRGCL